MSSPMTFGWVDDPDAVSRTVAAIEAESGQSAEFAVVGAHLMAVADANSPVFFWDAEEKVLGRRLDTWNQRQVGSCVGFGGGRAAQDLLLWEVAAGEGEEWPGAEVSPEVVYAGSRVEVGNGRLRGQDGSLGAWAAKFLSDWGVVKRGVYGSINLTSYNENLCRQLGDSGLPTDLENVAREHPVTAVAQVRNGDEGWAALGAGKPISICSNRGFAMSRNSDGSCTQTGVWNHCMPARGRFLNPARQKRIVLGNSWGDYLGSSNSRFEYLDADGKVQVGTLPAGHFHTSLDVFHGMLAQNDSFALAGLSGWKKVVVKVNHNPLA